MRQNPLTSITEAVATAIVGPRTSRTYRCRNCRQKFYIPLGEPEPETCPFDCTSRYQRQ